MMFITSKNKQFKIFFLIAFAAMLSIITVSYHGIYYENEMHKIYIELEELQEKKEKS